MFELNTIPFIVIFAIALLLILAGMICYAWVDGDNKKRLCKIGIIMTVIGCVIAMISLNRYEPKSLNKAETKTCYYGMNNL